MEIYLDNAATTKPCEEAVNAAMDCMSRNYGNPSSLHRKGLDAELVLSDARKVVAAALGAEPDCFYFTSGATESNNTALFGTAAACGKRHPRIVASSVEHASIRSALKELEERGFEVERVSPNENGVFTADDVLERVDGRTCLVTMMLVNNETGYILPAEKIFSAVKREYPQCVTHCDAVQGFMKMPVKAGSLGADIISVSAHKVHGCKGIGGLYIKKGVRLKSLLFGGEQERGLRPGTENVPAAAAFGAAVKVLSGNIRERAERAEALRRHLLGALAETEGIAVNSGPDCSPYIINISVPGIRSEIMLHFLESKGIYVSSGSACSKGAQSGVLGEFGMGSALADSALRISLSAENTEEELDAFVSALKEGMGRLVRSK